jgi:hypothetical protein
MRAAAAFVGRATVRELQNLIEAGRKDFDGGRFVSRLFSF